MTDSALVNGFVHIVESPFSTDLLDGRTEGRALSEALSLAQIPHRYCVATNRATLSLAINERLITAATELKRMPVLHLSMHGDTKGIALTDGDFIEWDELRMILLPQLEAMQGGLLICMSTCFGGFAGQIAMHDDDKPPFWALVGNTENTVWADAAVAFITFYHLFFKAYPLSHCVEAMRVASGDTNFITHSGQHLKENWVQRQYQKSPEYLRMAAELMRNARIAVTGSASSP